MTNYEKLMRDMTLSDMAILLAHPPSRARYCPPNDKIFCHDYQSCSLCWAEWLESETGDGLQKGD